MELVKRFWFFFALQIGLVLVAIVMVAALDSLGVSRGVSIAVSAALTIPVVFAVVYRLKRRDEQQLAAMPSAEARRYESRRLRIGFAVALVGTAVFAVVALTAQTPQAIFVLLLYFALTLSVGRRLWSERRGEAESR